VKSTLQLGMARPPRLLTTAIRWFVLGVSFLLGAHAETKHSLVDETQQVTGVVTTLTQAENGKFRYVGRFLVDAPDEYTGKEVELFVLAHDKDPRAWVGKNITFEMSKMGFEMSMEPLSGYGRPQAPHLSLELFDEGFRVLDAQHYERPIAARGIIRSYTVDKGDKMYLQWDVGFTGDMVEVEINDPAKYRGVIVHVLVDEDEIHGNTHNRRDWNHVGSHVSFTAPESSLAFEPWGFTPVVDLHDVKLEAAKR